MGFVKCESILLLKRKAELFFYKTADRLRWMRWQDITFAICPSLCVTPHQSLPDSKSSFPSKGSLPFSAGLREVRDTIPQSGIRLTAPFTQGSLDIAVLCDTRPYIFCVISHYTVGEASSSTIHFTIICYKLNTFGGE